MMDTEQTLYAFPNNLLDMSTVYNVNKTKQPEDYKGIYNAATIVKYKINGI